MHGQTMNTPLPMLHDYVHYGSEEHVALTVGGAVYNTTGGGLVISFTPRGATLSYPPRCNGASSDNQVIKLQQALLFI